MTASGRIVFSKMEEVVFGRPAAEAVTELVERQGANRVFLMVSGTLNRETDEIEKLRRALGNKCAGTFDKMPAHSPRAAVVAASEGGAAATIGAPAPFTGADLVRLRAERKLSQRDMADLLGVEQGTISKGEGKAGAAVGPALQEALARLAAGGGAGGGKVIPE